MTATGKTRRTSDVMLRQAAAIDTSALDVNVGYVVRRAQARIFADFHRTCADLTLKPAAYSVLLLVRENPDRKPSEFADLLGIQRPNFASLIDDLCRRRLLARKPSLLDRRSHTLSLTVQGAAVLADSVERVAEHNARMTQRLSSSDVRQLMALLEKIGR